MGDWAGRWERGGERVTKLGRLYETGIISVSGEPDETGFQLAAPLAGLSKDQQPNTEIKTILISLESFLRHIFGKSDKEAAAVSVPWRNKNK